MALLTLQTYPVGHEDGKESPYQDVCRIIAGPAGEWSHPEAKAPTEIFTFEVTEELARRIIEFAQQYLTGGDRWYNCHLFAHEVTTGEKVGSTDALVAASEIGMRSHIIAPCPATGQQAVIGFYATDESGPEEFFALHSVVGLGEGYTLQIDKIQGRLRLAECSALLEYYRKEHHDPKLRFHLA